MLPGFRSVTVVGLAAASARKWPPFFSGSNLGMTAVSRWTILLAEHGSLCSTTRPQPRHGRCRSCSSRTRGQRRDPGRPRESSHHSSLHAQGCPVLSQFPPIPWALVVVAHLCQLRKQRHHLLVAHEGAH